MGLGMLSACFIWSRRKKFFWFETEVKSDVKWFVPAEK